MFNHLAIALTLMSTMASAAGAGEVNAASLREQATKSVTLIDRTSASFLETRKCFTCHTQTFAVMVLTDARKVGIDINGQNLKAQVDRSFEIFDSLPGVRPDTVGHALFALDVGQVPRNDKTDAMVRYLLDYGKETGHWQVAIADREPAEASNFATNYFAVRGTNRYGTADLREAIDARRKAVEAWFATAEAKDTEDQVFRLFLAEELGIPEEQRKTFTDRLLGEQRAGGGWGQKLEMEPDAYATASALVALNRAGGVSANHPRWQDGIRYLLSTQNPDGSWHVVSRVRPVQEYFESGFPHGKDQFISTFATGWATEALLICLREDN
jgi:hypothetical protein